MKHFKPGDFVLRRRKSVEGDWFKCHPFSFGQVIEYRTETRKSRPDVAHIYDEKWEEVVVMPYDTFMAPIKDRPWVQWGEKDMIKISKFTYSMLGILWPILKLGSVKPLDGRITDY